MKAKTKTKSKLIEATISAWASAYNCTFDTFEMMLQRAGIKHKSGELLSAQDVFQAVSFRSEKDEAIARAANAKAEEQEMENAVRRKELMELSGIEKKIWNDLLAPLRTELEQMPKSLCSLCNPEEPEVAEKVLHQWVEKTKTNIQEKNK